MKFNPLKVESKVTKYFSNNGDIFMGYIKSLSDNDFIKFMENWVAVIDNYIMRTQRYSPFYIELFSNRGVTYNEYLKLFLNIEEPEYKNFVAYEYFMITDKIALSSFRIENESTKEGYIKIIKCEIENGNLKGLQTIINRFKANISKHALQTHAYISGATGTGKSELMKLLICNLTKDNNSGIVLIDPHGDLAKETLSVLAEKYPDRIIYIDPFFKENNFPVINPLETDNKNDLNIDITAQNITAAFCELLPNELSVNMKALLIPCLSVLLRKGDGSLIDLQKLIKGDRELVEFARSNSKHHKLFFDNYHDGLYTQTKSALFTKLQHLLNSFAFSNCILGKNTLNIGSTINENKIILFNLN